MLMADIDRGPPASPVARVRPFGAIRMIRWMLTAVASVVFTLASHAQTLTRWYAVELFGAKAGSLRQQQEHVGDTIVSRSNLAFELNRGAVKVSLTMSSEFVETAARMMARRTVLLTDDARTWWQQVHALTRTDTRWPR
jgi:hypothetical protein